MVSTMSTAIVCIHNLQIALQSIGKHKAYNKDTEHTGKYLDMGKHIKDVAMISLKIDI